MTTGVAQMKSVVCNLFGMALGVACLALVLNRPAVAEDKKENEVTQAKKRVVVVRGDKDSADAVADALKKALGDKMEGLSDEIKKKIHEKLKAAKKSETEDVKVEVVPAATTVSAKKLEEKSGKDSQVIMVTVDATGKKTTKVVTDPEVSKKMIMVMGSDGNVEKIELDGSIENALEAAKSALKKHEAQARTHQIEAIKAIKVLSGNKAAAEKQLHAAAKQIAEAKKQFAVKLKKAAAKAEKQAVEQEVTLTAKAEGDSDEKKIEIAVAIDGEDLSAKDGEKSFTIKMDNGKLILNGKPMDLPVLQDGKKGQVRVRVQKQGEAKKNVHKQHKMIFMSDEGKTQEFEFDIDVDADNVWVEKVDGAKAGQVHQHLYVVTQDDEDGDAKVVKKTIRVHAMPLDSDKHAAFNVIKMGSIVAPHGAHESDTADAKKVHIEFSKRLKGIEAELKKIRKLLEQMNDDDEDDDEDHDHDHDHDDDGHDEGEGE
jgi:hypothetical protein